MTSAVDYVMPSSDLIKHLKNAVIEKRLGEVILLSAIALRDVPPEAIQTGLFEQVIDGLITVGLIDEARSFAHEVILSQGVEKI